MIETITFERFRTLLLARRVIDIKRDNVYPLTVFVLEGGKEVGILGHEGLEFGERP